MKLFDILEDVEFKEGRSRKEFASGVDHMVFTATDNSDIVYKLGPKIAVDYWFDDFYKNPKLFPKVYKRGKTSIKLKSEKTIRDKGNYKTFPVGTILPLDYVVLEKLDTDRVQREWNELDMISEDIREIDSYGFYDFLISYMVWRPEYKEKGWNDDTTIGLFEKEMKARGKRIYNTYRAYVDVVDKVKAVKPGVPDLHRYNFGYDKNGVLKCLDF